MLRYLYLLRHAQSADKQIGQTDKERALTPIGLMEARAVGIFFKEKSLIPELIITSSALRAKTTSQTVAKILNYDVEKIVTEDCLYEATISTFSQILSKLDYQIKNVLLVGHNPVLTFFADSIIDQQNSLRPAEVLVLKSKAANWIDVQKGNTELLAKFHPLV
jgi:phosphohistidine phosphatase